MQPNYKESLEILDKSKIIFTEEQLNQAIAKMAKSIEKEIIYDIPVFLSVMNGGMFFASKLLQQIKGPFLCEYIHTSRYGDTTIGSSHITWYHQPKVEIFKDRTIYILDDILDEGYTLFEIKRFLLSAGAKDCKIAVLIDKNIGKDKPIKADYIGFESPNHFLFGYGMDIYGLYRQLPDIYAFVNE